MRQQQMFAVACAIARDAGIPEPAFADFRREWSIPPRLDKIADRAWEVSHQLYRNAIIKRADGRLVSAGLDAICSVVLNPRKAIWRIKRQLGNVDNQIRLGNSW